MLDQLSGCECAYLAVKEAVKHGDKEALCGRGGGGGGGCRGGEMERGTKHHHQRGRR